MQKLFLYHQEPSGESQATRKQPLVGIWWNHIPLLKLLKEFYRHRLIFFFGDLRSKKEICAAYSRSFLVRIAAKAIREALVQSSFVTLLFTTRNLASIPDIGNL